jgi:hypothetical protein
VTAVASKRVHPGSVRDTIRKQTSWSMEMELSPLRSSPPQSLAPLLVVEATIATFAAFLALIAPSVAVGMPVARAIAIGFVIASVLITSWYAPVRGERRLLWFVALAALYAFLFWLDLPALTPNTMFVVTLAVLTTGALVGGYIGSLLEYPGMLMVVAYVAAITDCFSVFHPNGLTAKVLAHPRALQLLTFPFPVLGTREIGSLLGIGDVAFASLFVVGARTTGLDPRRTVVALGLAMLMVAVATETMRMPLPALPFLSAAVVLAHSEARRLPPTQTRRIAANLALVTLVLGGLLLSATLRYS